jgi:hypothetical protein
MPQHRENNVKTFTGLLSLAIIGGGLIASVSAHADTAYHTVYHDHITATDEFSILDKYQNNVLTPDEYNNSKNKAPFSAVNVSGTGFITRTEFYGYNNGKEFYGHDEQAEKNADQPDASTIMPGVVANSTDDGIN